MSIAPLVRLTNITMTFPGVRALQNVSFDLLPGEVHVLLGENGAGKSTLMKVLAGAYQPDSGEIEIKGHKVRLANPQHAQQLGVSTIYQEFNLVPYLSVAQNIYLGRYPKRQAPLGFLVDHKTMREDSRKVLNSLNMDVDPASIVATLGVAQQQMVEVAKALSIDAQVLIMDEPTATLTDREIEKLFAMINRLRERGMGIIYISHRLNEVHQVGDRVTVLRDGQLVDTRDVKDLTVDQMVHMMVGRDISNMFPRTYQCPGEEALRVRNLSSARSGLKGIDLVLHTGEIVGLAGLVGSGRTELVRAIFGADPIDCGEIFLFGNRVTGLSPTQLVDKGMGLLPEDRKATGLALKLPVSENVVMASLQKLFPNSVVDLNKERTVVDKYVKDLRIATPSQKRLVQFLSGGTQQKVVMAKWLATESRVLIFDEPTRGIDVGAKAEIHDFMDRLVAQGAAVLMVSSDLPEVLGMSDRVYVMHEGAVVGEFARDDAKAERVIACAMGRAEATTQDQVQDDQSGREA
jgi:ribose transport system ATP-binding protein